MAPVEETEEESSPWVADASPIDELEMVESSEAFDSLGVARDAAVGVSVEGVVSSVEGLVEGLVEVLEDVSAGCDSVA